ncbi:hypothetical protein BH09BAC4_BH09BAC4_51120 [soil metagenome]
MKTILTSVLFLAAITVGAAQSNKYQKAMETQVAVYDTARSIATLQRLMGAFGRIGAVEKTEWLPYYYAGMCATSLANAEPDKARTDTWADQAETFVQKADSLSPNNSEVSVLLATVHFARINVDFMGRGPKYSALGGAALGKALQQNPNNPRAMVVLAQLRLTAPDGFGGDKAEGCQLATKAKGIYATELATSLQPHWGRGGADRLAAKCGEK